MPGFEIKELCITIPLEEELIIPITLNQNELEPITVFGKKEPWEENLEKHLRRVPDSDDDMPYYKEDMFALLDQEEKGTPGIPILSPIFMLIDWLKNNH